jgi:hypothetical protein
MRHRVPAYGIFPEGAQITLLRGDLASRRFVVAYGQQGKVVGVLGWNSPRELRDLRQLVVDRASYPRTGRTIAEGRSGSW